MALMVALLITITLALSSPSIHFSRDNKFSGPYLTSKPNYFIARDKYKILFQFDLTNFFNAIVDIEKYARKITEACHLVQNNLTCRTIVEFLSQHIRTMKDNIAFIDAYKNIDATETEFSHFSNITLRRKKRGLGNWLGHNYFRWLFGLMDNEDREKIQEYLNGLTNTVGRHSKAISETMTFMNAKIDLNQHEFEEMKKGVELLYERVNNHTLELNTEVRGHLDITELTNLAILMENLHQKISTKLLSLLKESVNGVFSDLVPFEFLQEQLDLIQLELPFGKKSIPNNRVDIEKMVKMRGAIFNGEILIYIEIPVIESTEYELVKIIPLPTRLANSEDIWFNIPNDYYLLSLTEVHYIPMSAVEESQCKRLLDGRQVCVPNTISYKKNDNRCESNFFFNPNLRSLLLTCDYTVISSVNFVIPMGNNSYFMYLRKPFIAHYSCPNEAENQGYELTQSGILYLSRGCSLATDELIIYAPQLHDQTDMIEIPIQYRYPNTSRNEINLMAVQREKIQLDHIKFASDFRDQRGRIDNVITQSISEMNNANQNLNQFPENQTVDYWAYIKNIIVFIIIMIIIMLVLTVLLKCKKLCTFG